MKSMKRDVALCIFLLCIQQSFASPQAVACNGEDGCIKNIVATFDSSRTLRQSKNIQLQDDKQLLERKSYCTNSPIDVTGASEEELQVVCSAGRIALKMLARCDIAPHRRLNVEIVKQVRQKTGNKAFGILNTQHEKILVTQRVSASSLFEDTPYNVLSHRVFYHSLMVHEIIHGITFQNWVRKPNNRSAHEYLAYALQIEALSSGDRAKLLEDVNSKTESKFFFNDIILSFDPLFFAAQAHRHFRATSDRCATLRSVLEGKASFIASLPTF